MQSWLQWPQYVVAARYGLFVASATEFDQSRCLPQNCNDWSKLEKDNNIVPGDVWWYYLSLIALMVGFRFIAMAILYAKAKNMGA